MSEKLKPAEMMPGSFGLPIIGELIGFLRKREEFYWQKHQDNGNIFKTSSLPLFCHSGQSVKFGRS